jgi:DNA helicase II / ATP-dependent DNA helicase PcrA
LIEELNPEQKRAVHHVEGPALVIAGAGSGKTRVVTYRIAHLLSLGTPAQEILALTFTNKAAGEMRRRVEEKTQAIVLTCTFHSLGARILRESIHHLEYKNDFTIYDEDDTEKLLRECIGALSIKEDKGFLKTARGAISHAKNQLLPPEVVAKEDSLTGQLYALYQTKLKEYQAVDFDDLLYLPILLFRHNPTVLEHYQNRWGFILIDEYQDTNAAQHTLVKMVAAKHHNVFAVGDPDQSIYSWRGANLENILNFERDFPGALIITLDQNYRSRSTILNAANSLIQHNISRFAKNLWSVRGPGEKIGVYAAMSDRQEAEFVALKLLDCHLQTPYSDCAILYRTNFQSRLFEDLLLRLKIPYIIVGGISFYQRREIKDILCLLRMVVGSSDFIAFSRMVNIPKRGLGESFLLKLQEGASERGLPIFDFCVAILNGQIDFKLSLRQREGLGHYSTMIESLRTMAREKVALSTIVSEAIERSRYLNYLQEDPESYEERKDNLGQLVSKATEWEEENRQGGLPNFLEELSLKGAIEERDGDAVRLMTLHSGKGLEFSLVFLVGMEEDLFPHVNSRDDQEKLQEERRLCYVGMTRAKERLYLTHARFRFLWGISRSMQPSRFLDEILPEYTEDLSHG